MSTTSQPHNNGGSKRRTRPAGDNSLSRSLRRLSSFCEALVVLSLTFGAFSFYVMSRYDRFQAVWWVCAACLVLLLILAVVSYRFAVKFNLKSRRADSLVERLSRHEVTDQRIKTLAVKGVQTDVLDGLKEIQGNGNGHRWPMTEKDFTKELEEKLGPERAREFKEVILKYTRVRDAGQEVP